MDKYNPEYLDQEEKELLEDINDMDPEAAPRPTAAEQSQFREAAARFLRKETKMNIRIDPYELGKIKELADRAGLRYQTFIKSILHKYITGQLVEQNQK